MTGAGNRGHFTVGRQALHAIGGAGQEDVGPLAANCQNRAAEPPDIAPNIQGYRFENPGFEFGVTGQHGGFGIFFEQAAFQVRLHKFGRPRLEDPPAGQQPPEGLRLAPECSAPPPGGASGLTIAAGIKKGEGSTLLHDRKQGWLRTWEPIRKGQAGNLGCGIVMDPTAIVEITEAEGNYLVIARCDSRAVASYYAGFGWDRSGDFSDAAAWTEYMKNAAMKLRSPLRVEIQRQ